MQGLGTGLRPARYVRGLKIDFLFLGEVQVCLFSIDPQRDSGAEPVKVDTTRIFARGLTDGRQALVYSMRYSSVVDMAMVLPLPTPPTPHEGAVEFIDLSQYATFFDDMDLGFPSVPRSSAFETLSIGDTPASVLRVHNVGSFEASFVPTQRDFSRLDARFRLPDRVLDALPLYLDYAFAVFKLKPGAVKIHPLAFIFPRRNTQELFFPTVHAHDGTVSAKAHFDHMLYGQFRCNSRIPGWDRSRTWRPQAVDFDTWFREYAEEYRRPVDSFSNIEVRLLREYLFSPDYAEVTALARQFIDVSKAKELVMGDAPVSRRSVVGILENRDLVFSDS